MRCISTACKVKHFKRDFWIRGKKWCLDAVQPNETCFPYIFAVSFARSKLRSTDFIADLLDNRGISLSTMSVLILTFSRVHRKSRVTKY